MPLKLKLRGNVWWIRGTVHKEQIYETTGTHSKEVAEAIRTKREAGLVSDHVFGPQATRDFSDAAISYLEAGGDARFIGSELNGIKTGLLGHFYDRKLRTITQNDLDQAARTLYPNAAPETRNRQCYTPFIAIWNHAVRNKWAEVQKWTRPRKIKGTNVARLRPVRSGSAPVEYDRAAQFVEAMSPGPAMIMTALFYSGLRPIELFAMDAADVDLVKRWLVVRSSKTGEPRGVPVHRFLMPLFAALLPRGGAVFRTPRGQPYPAVEDGGGGLKSAINGARRRLEAEGTPIRDVSPYTARHSVSTGLVVAGVHPHIKDQILGHAVDDMSRRYTKVPQAPLIEAIDKLPVPAPWAELPWWEDPLGWSGRLAEGMGKRTDMWKLNAG